VGVVTGADPTMSAQRYTRTAALLHWVIAALIVANLVMGYVCANSELAIEDAVMNLHKVSGIAILALSLFRLAWRLSHRPPALAYQSSAQRLAAGVVHTGLYVLMIAVPVTGWLVTSSFPKRHPISMGMIDIPFLPVTPDLPRAMLMHEAHEVLATTMAIAVIGHVLAAAYHQWVTKDHPFDRMKLGA
jgi:cytochrome b561